MIYIPTKYKENWRNFWYPVKPLPLTRASPSFSDVDNWIPKGDCRFITKTQIFAPNYWLKSNTFGIIFKKSCEYGNFENHAPTPQLGIKFWKKGPLSSEFLRHLTFDMILKKSCEKGNYENLTPNPKLDIKFLNT